MKEFSNHTMFKSAVVLALLALGALATPAYKSYVAVCDSSSSSVTFVNYPEHHCAGTSWNVTNQLNTCVETELPIVHIHYTWNAFCNSSAIWFNNFKNLDCSGSSILTRTYLTYQCVDCPWYDSNCKNGPPIAVAALTKKD